MQLFLFKFNILTITNMKKDYQTPTMEVDKMESDAPLLLQVSGQVNATMDGTWEEENL